MKPSRKVYEAISFVVILLFGGLSAAQEPKAKDWGNTAHGLQMRIYLDEIASNDALSAYLDVLPRRRVPLSASAIWIVYTNPSSLSLPRPEFPVS